MATEQKASSDANFLDMQACIGITKHTGGTEATDELLSLCHIENAHEALHAGCGIGVGPAHIAKKYKCHVVGVDISEKMIEWSRRRAREERVESEVEFRTADVLDLPFEADRFDVVISESVLIFVEDKARAIRECVRVTKPGGYVGLNEGLWIKQPPPEMAARVSEAIGPFVPTCETWQSLWEASGLQERVLKTCQTDARTEVMSRIRWIGWWWLLRAWGRGLRLYIADPAVRQAIKEMFDVPAEVFEYVGYGLFAGRK
ncbi:MAG: class I SAM-dependent methyltransferase [Anaerolineae bacterium]|nr:class I SAM-dependent methyltransferase [Anaerolineae bacterium]